MNILDSLCDGRTMTKAHDATYDFVVVGSGPAGSAVACVLAQGGARVAVIEEGSYVTPEQVPEDGFTSMAKLYRDIRPHGKMNPDASGPPPPRPARRQPLGGVFPGTAGRSVRRS